MGLSSRKLSPLSILVYLFVYTAHLQLVNGVAKWSPSDLWSECSSECGPGIEKRLFVCLDTSRLNTSRLVDEAKCGPLPNDDQVNKTETTRACDWGTCSRKTRWRVSPWGDCSQVCGGRGEATRDIECVMSSQEGDVVISDSYASTYCEINKRPNSRAPCNRFNCAPEFSAHPWDKCEQNDPCLTGIQRRKLTCRSLNANGTYNELPMRACYIGRQAPPKNWQRCYIPEIAAKCTMQEPVIEEGNLVVVQMRSVRKMRLQVGEEAYILPGTRLAISCPVKFFAGSNIVWKHFRRGEFHYEGQKMSNIFLTKTGRLVIRNFQPDDKGEWKCIAGNRSASIMLHYNQPSSGLSDWVQRYDLKNREMMNDDPGVLMNRQSWVQWVTEPWSNCSIPCGGRGIQTRKVRCEKLKTGIYYVMPDEECTRQFLAKPKTQRECVNLIKCPQWKFIKASRSKCTDQCVAVGKGTLDGRTICTLSSQEIPSYNCDSMEKPDISCENPVCQVNWTMLPWSKCSVTCGGAGLQYREKICTWKHNGGPAGSLCEETKVEAPPAVQPCTTEPCKTVCLDLHDDCKSHVNWCGFRVYQHICCATCRDYALQRNWLS